MSTATLSHAHGSRLRDMAAECADLVAQMDSAELMAELDRPKRLLMDQVQVRSSIVTMAWAPFDHVNHSAKIAIIGITPGREQMTDALMSYRLNRRQGIGHEEALAKAKSHASFSGAMRKRLVRILNEVGIHRHLGLNSSADLWSEAGGLAHFTSALRWPVFVNGKNFTGHQPNITSLPLFRSVLEGELADELASLPADCLIAPLGGKAIAAVDHAARLMKGLDPSRVLRGLPHPSGAANDQSGQFLGDPPGPGRQKPLNPEYRRTALRLRQQVADLS